MNLRIYRPGLFPLALLFLLCQLSVMQAQPGSGATHWAADGYQYYRVQNGQLVELDTRDSAKRTVVLTTEMLTPPGLKAIPVENFRYDL